MHLSQPLRILTVCAGFAVIALTGEQSASAQCCAPFGGYARTTYFRPLFPWLVGYRAGYSNACCAPACDPCGSSCCTSYRPAYTSYYSPCSTGCCTTGCSTGCSSGYCTTGYSTSRIFSSCYAPYTSYSTVGGCSGCATTTSYAPSVDYVPATGCSGCTSKVERRGSSPAPAYVTRQRRGDTAAPVVTRERRSSAPAVVRSRPIEIDDVGPEAVREIAPANRRPSQSPIRDLRRETDVQTTSMPTHRSGTLRRDRGDEGEVKQASHVRASEGSKRSAKSRTRWEDDKPARDVEEIDVTWQAAR